MKWFPRILLAVALVAVLGSVASAQNTNTTPPIRNQALRFLDASLRDAGSGPSVTTWSLDTSTGTADTSVTYEIAVGSYVAFSYQLNAATDTVDQMIVQGSLDGTNWADIDSTGQFVGASTVIKRIDEPAGSSVEVSPVYVRYLRFVITKDVDEAADATVLTGWVVSSPVEL